MKKLIGYLLAIVATAVMTAAITALLINIQERKTEGKWQDIKIVEVDEETTDPAIWGKNYPRQYDGYKKTGDTERTRYGGSEAYSKIDQNPIWKRIFAGYGFGVDYREERGHAYSLSDQQETLRTKQFQQPGACLQCHGGGMKYVYETVGEGDLQAGFKKVNAMPLEEAWKYVKHPIACIDCHDPKTMDLRVTRPAFLNAMKKVKAKEGIENFDPNKVATRQEMRTFVCAQCHVEYYFKGKDKMLTYPWDKGWLVEQIESYYDETGFKDWTHAETGAPVLKAQHPEFEMWNQGIHARSGVSCTDCHMPYMREGALKVTDHHIRSPLLNVSRSCLPCHRFSEREMLDRVESIQTRTRKLMDRAEIALGDLLDEIVAAKKRGVGPPALDPALQMQRKAQWRLDFVSAENSMGFHAPQEAARILGEAIDYARQGQIMARSLERSVAKQEQTEMLTYLVEASTK